MKLVVFDCDGTLVDSQHAIVASMQSACAALGLPCPPAEAVRRVVGLSLMQGLQRLLPDHPAEVHDRFLAYFRDPAHRAILAARPLDPLYPGAVTAIDALVADGYALGIATGKPRRGLAAVLDGHGLHARFVTLKTADDGPSKPHPQMLLDAMAEAGAAPEDTVMVGDTSFDMAMARAAGAHALGVAWGYHERDELEAAGAEVVVDNFAAVPAAVAALLGPVAVPAR